MKTVSICCKAGKPCLLAGDTGVYIVAQKGESELIPLKYIWAMPF
jgi:hypothetical protein